MLSPSVGRLLCGIHKEPDVPAGVQWSDRPRRSSPGRLSSGSRVLLRPACTVLGEPRPDAGHAAGQRLWNAVSIWHLYVRQRAAAAGGGVPRSLPDGAHSTRIWADHYRDRAGIGVLLCWGLPPAVPAQEPEWLLRSRRHRSVVSSRFRHITARQWRVVIQSSTAASLTRHLTLFAGVTNSLQCFDTVGWSSGGASSL